LEQVEAQPEPGWSLEAEARPESRRATRVTLVADIECAGDAGSVRGRCGDVSIGGMFLELARSPFAAGDAVSVSFLLPGSPERVSARCEVRYVQNDIGIGLRFLEVRPADLDRVARFVSAMGAQRAPRQEETRRGSRVSVNVPVIMRGVAGDGNEFEELTEIVTLSKNGACLLLKGPVRVGMKVQLSTPKGQQFTASVVWLGDASRPQSRGQFGVQSRGLAHALGFRFP
jgi:hypothetical protein